MRDQLIQYVKLLFAGTQDREEMQQEILQNTLDRYDDLIDQGKTPEAAYRLAIAGIGDLAELLGDSPADPLPQDPAPVSKPKSSQRKKGVLHAIAIAMYICCVIPVILFDSLGLEEVGVCLMFAMIAVATLLITLPIGRNKTADNHATEEPPEKKPEKGIWGTVVLILYLLFSFLTHAWYITWIIFPISSLIQHIIKLGKSTDQPKGVLRMVILIILSVVLVLALLVAVGMQFLPGKGTVVEDQLILESDKINNFQIDWDSGEITIQKGNVDHIVIHEESNKTIRYPMSYRIDNDTLHLFCRSQLIALFPEGKHLYITVPQDWVCNELSIDSASTDIFITGLSIAALELDGASNTLQFSGNVDNVEIDGASATVKLECQNLVSSLDMSGASATMEFTGSVERVKISAASADVTLNCLNRVSSIELDGASCDLILTLPKGCGYHLDANGASFELTSDLPYHCTDDVYTWGDQFCKIHISGASCDVIILEGSN